MSYTGPSNTTTPRFTTFDSLYAHLRNTYSAPLLPPGKAYDLSLTDAISSLYLHPTLEAALHILNADLPSAHFLVRHMQAAPAVAGMYLHGILHRIEGDYDNARCWYVDVAREGCGAFDEVWEVASSSDDRRGDGNDGKDARGGGEDVKEEDELPKPQRLRHLNPRAAEFIDAIQTLHGQRRSASPFSSSHQEESRLTHLSAHELTTVISWCVREYGSGVWTDARPAWVRPSEEERKIGNRMVSEGEGRRKF
ncbi:hypothetical protein BJ546DRAFT_1068077 [Cryomyces antarcticus]